MSALPDPDHEQNLDRMMLICGVTAWIALIILKIVFR